MMHKVGVISDTHGLLRPGAMAALQGSEVILHAGDVGEPGILDALRSIAPVYAVRGNVDWGEWAEELPLTQAVQVGAVWLYILHDLETLDLDPAVAGFQAVISGHSHQPKIEQHGGVLFLNPGSAGMRRFKLPISLALLTVQGKEVKAELVNLEA